MGRAIFRAHDCHKNSKPLPPSFVAPNPNPKNLTQSRRRKGSSVPVVPPTSVTRFSPKELVMGQVRILKRGEELKKKSVRLENEDAQLSLCTTARLGPDPETVQKRLYAGSAFFASPPPSLVPVPGFLERIDDAATSDLRRLLKL